MQRGYYAHVLGEAPNTYTDAVEAIKSLRAKSGDPENPVSDQFLEPFVIVDEAGAPVGPVADGDAVVIFNFRADRVTEISKALEYDDFSAFDRCGFPRLSRLAEPVESGAGRMRLVLCLARRPLHIARVVSTVRPAGDTVPKTVAHGGRLSGIRMPEATGMFAWPRCVAPAAAAQLYMLALRPRR